MMELYNNTALDCSKVITRNYSTSFTLGIRTLNREFHAPIYAIYGFVRLADEIVDTFHDHNKNELLKRFREETYRAITEKISLNPVLHSFQLVVNQYGINMELIDAFLRSMEMDLSQKNYEENSYHEYIYGSAEVIGLMCLRVFTHGENAAYEKLKEPARRLGAAFQKVNFLRDIKSDFHDRGLVYFPGVDFLHFAARDKEKIESEIANDFEVAEKGILMLPKSSRNGVFLAYVYYYRLFNKIRKTPASKILHRRIRITDISKFMILLTIYFRNNIFYSKES
jgi:15-cis-phytoene synthase